MLRDFKNESDAEILDLESVQNSGKITSVKTNVNDGSDNLDDFSNGVVRLLG
jgi:hypothetical protein